VSGEFLSDEFYHAVDQVKPADQERLEQAGVSRQFLYRGAVRVGTVEAMTHTDGYYEPFSLGRRLYVVPAIPLCSIFDPEFDGNAPPIGDLIAFDLAEPNRFWVRTGAASFINPYAFAHASLYRVPLPVWSSPLAWLRAGGDGVVILDDTAHLPLWFGGLVAIQADSVELGRKIKARMAQQSKLPEIMVPAIRRVA
jgi:hypothetical protein